LSLSPRTLSLFLLAAALPAGAQTLGDRFLIGPASLGARVESVTSSGYRVVVPIPAPDLAPGVVFGQSLTEITIPGGSAVDPAGTPQLPCLTLFLRIPKGVTPRVSARAGPTRSLGTIRPEPLPHLLSDRVLADALGAARLEAWLQSGTYGGGATVEPPLLSYSIGAAGEERAVTVVLRPVRWDPRSGQGSVVDGITLDVSWEAAPRPARAPGAGFRSAAYSGPLRVQPDRPWVRLGVLRPGLYVLSAADLAAAGVTTAGIDPASFRIFRATPGDIPESTLVDAAPDSLRECAIVVTGEGDGSFDPGDRIIFYATGQTGFGYDLMLGGSINYQEAQRSDEESLWLTWGAFPSLPLPRRMRTRDAAPVTVAPTITSVPHRVHYEENRVRDFNAFAPGVRWERWFYRLFTQGSRIAFPLALPGAQPGGSGSLLLRLWGRGVSPGVAFSDHVANVYWDGAFVARDSTDQSTPFDVTASGLPVHAADTLQVEVPRIVDPDAPSRFDQSELAWFEITYPKRLSAINDTLTFASDTTFTGPVHYVVDGITDTTSVWLLERGDPENPIRYVNGAFAGATAPFVLTAEDSLGPGAPKRYSLVSTARAARPTIAPYAPASTGHTVSDLLDPGAGADYLIVTHPSLLAQAESLATVRSGRIAGIVGPRAAIATTDRIAAQLGAGYLDAVAIRNLLAYARLHWPGPAPTYVCLLGDATLDPKNYLGFNAPDLVPTYANYYDDMFPPPSQFVSDDFYGFLDGPGDLLLDVAVGRLPAKTTVEASIMIRKIRTYELNPEFDEWRARALLCADDSRKREKDDELGNLHVIEMERKDKLHIPYPIERSKVYLNDYAFADTLQQSKPAARDDFIARINQGNWFVDYIGHGSDLVLADEQVFRSNDVGRLTNASRPSVFGFFSCTVGKFDALGQEGLAELLLKSPLGGAVAAIASTELVFPFESTELNDEIMDQLFPIAPRVDSTLTIGSAYRQAKNLHRNIIARKYVLLGDPALPPPIPQGRGLWEKGPLDSLARGGLAVLQGHALASDSSPDTISSGVARIQIQGKPFDRKQTAIFVPRVVTYRIPGPILFRGEVPLVAGRFTARFVVPVDSRIAGGTGQLRALLGAAGGRGVGLAVDSIRIGQGISARTDLDPPTITLLHAAGSDSGFQAGDRVTFAIEDSSGIDLMRLDNAHTIFVILDDRGTPAELTASFVYDSGSYTRGTAVYTLPSQITEGLHTVEVHASDTFGNIAVRTFVLDVHSFARPGDPMQLSQVFNYPNPFEGTTYIHARLNQAGAIRVRILTVAGRRVRDLAVDGRAGENYLPWDGRDSQGENVAIGVYLLKVTAESPEGKRASAVGRALRTR